MHPVPIPVEAVWDGARRLVVAPPRFEVDHPTCHAVEAIVDVVEFEPGTDLPRFNLLIKLDAGDAELLEANGGHFWVSFIGQFLQPFDVSVDRPG